MGLRLYGMSVFSYTAYAMCGYGYVIMIEARLAFARTLLQSDRARYGWNARCHGPVRSRKCASSLPLRTLFVSQDGGIPSQGGSQDHSRVESRLEDRHVFLSLLNTPSIH